MEALNFGIHIASYDGVMMGFQGTLKNLENNYSFPISSGSLKSMCLLNKYLFAGGYDEIIRVFNLNKMKEEGQLEGHEGTITCLKGFKNFLFSGGEDGNILVWKVKDWGLVHKISAHMKAVYDIEIHSSGKLMVSIGKDLRLIVWNLLNLQKTFTRKFSYEIFKVKFNKTEDVIILMGEKKLHLLNIETNKMIKVLQHEQKIHDFIIYGDRYVITGDELGDVYIWDFLENKEMQDVASYIKFKAHDKRVKQIRLVKFESLDFMVTCSSDGLIKIWDVLFLVQKDQAIREIQDLGDKIESVFKIDSRERINCMEVNVNNPEKTNVEEVEAEDLKEEKCVIIKKKKGGNKEKSQGKKYEKTNEKKHEKTNEKEKMNEKIKEKLNEKKQEKTQEKTKEKTHKKKQEIKVEKKMEKKIEKRTEKTLEKTKEKTLEKSVKVMKKIKKKKL